VKFDGVVKFEGGLRLLTVEKPDDIVDNGV
jgi:hypothetical protein